MSRCRELQGGNSRISRPLSVRRSSTTSSLAPTVLGSFAAAECAARSAPMSAPKLDTKIVIDSEEFRARAAHNRTLAEKLRADVAEAAQGGPEKHRQRHVERGKLLPRDRVERLL